MAANSSRTVRTSNERPRKLPSLTMTRNLIIVEVLAHWCDSSRSTSWVQVVTSQASEIKAVPSEKRLTDDDSAHLESQRLQAKALSREKLDKACHGLNEHSVHWCRQ
jgi:hypothetical protein